VISAEDFFFIEDEAIISQLQHDLLKIFSDVKIIVYLLRQDKMAISLKAQGAKTIRASLVFGNTPCALPLMSKDVRSYLEYDRKLRIWANAFGLENIDARIFEPGELVNEDAVYDFVAASGLPARPSKFNRNLSLGVQPTLFLHRLRAEGIDHAIIWPLYKSHLIERKTGGKILPARKDAQAFQANFGESNLRLAKILGHEQIFRSDFDSYPEHEQTPELNLNYAVRNCKTILRHLRRTCTRENQTLLENTATILGKLDSTIEKDLTDIAKIIPSARASSAFQSHPTGATLSGVQNSSEHNFSELLQKIKITGKFANNRTAELLRRSATKICSDHPRLAYDLTKLVLVIRPYDFQARKLLEKCKLNMKSDASWHYHDFFVQHTFMIPTYASIALATIRSRI
jgi:hypothetical protein